MATTLGHFQYGTVSYLNSFTETLHSAVPATSDSEFTAHPGPSGTRAGCERSAMR